GISIFISWTVSFYLNYKFTFNYKGSNVFSVYKKFILLYLLTGGLNFILVYLLTDYFGLYYLASIIIVAFFIVISTFYINKNIIFKID
ncbi:GtrA family protein, partial [Patescibacteria group bacterium]|nr:GtrA family protein [Patescibacteria group bacterium]